MLLCLILLSRLLALCPQWLRSCVNISTNKKIKKRPAHSNHPEHWSVKSRMRLIEEGWLKRRCGSTSSWKHPSPTPSTCTFWFWWSVGLPLRVSPLTLVCIWRKSKQTLQSSWSEISVQARNKIYILNCRTNDQFQKSEQRLGFRLSLWTIKARIRLIWYQKVSDGKLFIACYW